MPVRMRYGEFPCKRCKGPGGWKRHVKNMSVSWKEVFDDHAKPTFETEWVNCPRCQGEGNVVLVGGVGCVVSAIANGCKID